MEAATNGLTTLTREIDCIHTAMGVPTVTSAIFLNIGILVKRRRLGEISEMPLLTLRG
jgi:hypothetical protein